MLRFHLDENMPRAVAEGLRARGFDVSTAAGADLMGAPDEGHLTFALSEDRLIVTRDTDFLRMAASGTHHAGIVFWKRPRVVGKLLGALDMLSLQYEPEQVRGQVYYR